MSMFKFLPALVLFLLCGPSFAQGPYTASVWSGCGVEARAYVKPGDGNTSRFDIRLTSAPGSTDKWDFTVDSDGIVNPNHGTQISNDTCQIPYGNQKTATIKATLWKYETLEEPVTFRDLDLEPLADDAETKAGFTPRFLSLKSPITETTPSGIQITLPAQNVQHFSDMFPVFDGNPNALFIRVQTTPDRLDSVVPLSPLYKKYGKPLRIQLDCEKPNYMVFYQADNTYKIIAIGLPDLKTVTNIGSLALIVRQRVNLEKIPISLVLPIYRQ
jgi:hypothetical protein